MEEFSRFIKLIGNDKFNVLKNKKVVIIGIGGVGGYAFEALVRGGISNITIIDYDIIDRTNLNRQVITNINNIGRYKVDVAKERALEINRNLNVTVIKEKLNEENVIDIIKDNDYIIDACDDVKAKKLIIRNAINYKIKFISSMGTGNKFNPELLKITDIRKTTYDKLAKKIRTWVIKEKIMGSIYVVSSTEECKKCNNVIGSTSFVPAVSGMLCASYVINDILNNIK